MRTFYAQKELKKKSASMLFWLSMLVHNYAPLSQDGGGWGWGVQPTGNLTFSVFKCQFPHPWVSILSQIPIPGAN